jgi:hypothetical protein
MAGLRSLLVLQTIRLISRSSPGSRYPPAANRSLPSPHRRIFRRLTSAVRHMGASAGQSGLQQGHKMQRRITGVLVLGLERAKLGQCSLAPLFELVLFRQPDRTRFERKLQE